MYLSCWLSCTNFEWPLDFNHSNTCCFLLIVYTVRGALEFNFLLGSGNRWYITRNLHVELNYATKGLKPFRSLKLHLNFSTDSNFTKVTSYGVNKFKPSCQKIFTFVLVLLLFFFSMWNFSGDWIWICVPHNCTSL